MKTVPPLFPPNVYLSGTITPGYRDFDRSLAWPDDNSSIGSYSRKTVGFDELYTSLSSDLRIPLVGLSRLLSAEASFILLRIR